MARRRQSRRLSLKTRAKLAFLAAGLIVIGVLLLTSPIPTIAGLLVLATVLIWLGFRRRGRRRLRARTLGELLLMTPAQFEFAVAGLLHDLGYSKVKRVGGAGDLAADITCLDRQKRAIVVQCKRYAPGHRVGSREVQLFIGMITVHHHADAGIFVTTSAFTAPAEALARQHAIELIDGEALTRLLRLKRGQAPRALSLQPPAMGASRRAES